MFVNFFLLILPLIVTVTAQAPRVIGYYGTSNVRRQGASTSTLYSSPQPIVLSEWSAPHTASDSAVPTATAIAVPTAPTATPIPTTPAASPIQSNLPSYIPQPIRNEPSTNAQPALQSQTSAPLPPQQPISTSFTSEYKISPELQPKSTLDSLHILKKPIDLYPYAQPDFDISYSPPNQVHTYPQPKLEYPAAKPVPQSQPLPVQPVPTVKPETRTKSSAVENGPIAASTLRSNSGSAFEPIYRPYRPVQSQTNPASAPQLRPTNLFEPGTGNLFDVSLKNFHCKNGYGYYPVPNECETYIECQENVIIKYLCPDGFQFNPKAKWNEFPCGLVSEIKCSVGPRKEKPKRMSILTPLNQCPEQFGFFSMQDGECSKYLMCQEGKATVMDCPNGLVFNEKTSGCDWPENVPSCSPNAFKDILCPEPPLDVDGNISDVMYKYKYGNQCKTFVACQRGHPRLISCDNGYLFDESSQACVGEDYMTNCLPNYK